jgi:hypothetical protein
MKIGALILILKDSEFGNFSFIINFHNYEAHSAPAWKI